MVSFPLQFGFCLSDLPLQITTFRLTVFHIYQSQRHGKESKTILKHWTCWPDIMQTRFVGDWWRLICLSSFLPFYCCFLRFLILMLLKKTAWATSRPNEVKKKTPACCDVWKCSETLRHYSRSKLRLPYFNTCWIH